jgi:hypothetical protein
MKMRKFERGGFATSEDSEYNEDRMGDFIAGFNTSKNPGAPTAASNDKTDDERARTNPVVSSKSKIITKEELAKSGMSLRDYMNEKQGLTRRKDKVNPTLGEAKDKNAQDAADAIDPGDARTKEIGKTRGGPSYDSSGKPSNAGPDVEYKPQSLNKRTGATAKMMSDFNNQANKRTGRGYASGGSISASSRGDGIAQRGKTRGKMC